MAVESQRRLSFPFSLLLPNAQHRFRSFFPAKLSKPPHSSSLKIASMPPRTRRLVTQQPEEDTEEEEARTTVSSTLPSSRSHSFLRLLSLFSTVLRHSLCGGADPLSTCFSLSRTPPFDPSFHSRWSTSSSESSTILPPSPPFASSPLAVWRRSAESYTTRLSFAQIGVSYHSLVG